MAETKAPHGAVDRLPIAATISGPKNSRPTPTFHNNGSARDNNNQSVYCRTSLPREPRNVARLFAVVGDEHIPDMIGISKPSKLCRRHPGRRLCDGPFI
jgi:hypothetical protein